MLGDAAAFEERLLRRRAAEELGEVVQDLSDASRGEDEISVAPARLRVEGVLLKTCMEIKLLAPHAIDATLSPLLRLET